MDVIFTFIILLGVIMLGFGIASMYQGHNVVASVRQPVSSVASLRCGSE